MSAKPPKSLVELLGLGKKEVAAMKAGETTAADIGRLQRAEAQGFDTAEKFIFYDTEFGKKKVYQPGPGDDPYFHLYPPTRRPGAPDDFGFQDSIASVEVFRRRGKTVDLEKEIKAIQDARGKIENAKPGSVYMDKAQAEFDQANQNLKNAIEKAKSDGARYVSLGPANGQGSPSGARKTIKSLYPNEDIRRVDADFDPYKAKSKAGNLLDSVPPIAVGAAGVAATQGDNAEAMPIFKKTVPKSAAEAVKALEALRAVAEASPGVRASPEAQAMIEIMAARFNNDEKVMNRIRHLQTVGHDEPYWGGDVTDVAWRVGNRDKAWNEPFPMPSKVNDLGGVLGKGVPQGNGPDPFMWMDRKYESTKKILKDHRGKPLEIHTRSDLAAHEEYLAELDPKNHKIFMHIATGDADIARAIEPGAASPKRRLIAARRLQDAGFDVTIVHDKFTNPGLEAINTPPNVFQNEEFRGLKGATNPVTLNADSIKRLSRATGQDFDIKAGLGEKFGSEDVGVNQIYGKREIGERVGPLYEKPSDFMFPEDPSVIRQKEIERLNDEIQKSQNAKPIYRQDKNKTVDQLLKEAQSGEYVAQMVGDNPYALKATKRGNTDVEAVPIGIPNHEPISGGYWGNDPGEFPGERKALALYPAKEFSYVQDAGPTDPVKRPFGEPGAQVVIHPDGQVQRIEGQSRLRPGMAYNYRQNENSVAFPEYILTDKEFVEFMKKKDPEWTKKYLEGMPKKDFNYFLKYFEEADKKKKAIAATATAGAAIGGAQDALAADLQSPVKSGMREIGEHLAYGLEQADRYTARPFRAAFKAILEGNSMFGAMSEATYGDKQTTGEDVAEAYLKRVPGMGVPVGDKVEYPMAGPMGFAADMTLDPLNLIGAEAALKAPEMINILKQSILKRGIPLP